VVEPSEKSWSEFVSDDDIPNMTGKSLKIPWFQSTNQECQNIISVKSPRFFGLPQVWTAECLLWPHFLGLKIQGLCPQKWTSKLMEISGKLIFFLIYELLLTTIIPIYDSIS
jgi:hypothetical protein